MRNQTENQKQNRAAEMIEEIFDIKQDCYSLNSGKWTATQFKRYCAEWNVKTRLDIETSLEERQESIVCKLAELLGITFEQANQIVIEAI